jgi:hypothetical protein
MNRSSPSLRIRVLALSALFVPCFIACGEDGSDPEESGGSGGTGAVIPTSGSSGSAGKGGSGTGGSSAGKGGSGGSSSAGKGGSGTGGSGGSGEAGAPSGKGGSGATAEGGSGAGDGEGGTGTGDMFGGAPGAMEDGSSPYVPDCDETNPCLTPGVTCLGVRLNEGGYGFTCSNQCDAVNDCSGADSGAEATPGCVEFTAASRCVLVCYEDGEERSCPTGMGCYRYPNFPVGYCLWL